MDIWIFCIFKLFIGLWQTHTPTKMRILLPHDLVVLRQHWLIILCKKSTCLKVIRLILLTTNIIFLKYLCRTNLYKKYHSFNLLNFSSTFLLLPNETLLSLWNSPYLDLPGPLLFGWTQDAIFYCYTMASSFPIHCIFVSKSYWFWYIKILWSSCYWSNLSLHIALLYICSNTLENLLLH